MTRSSLIFFTNPKSASLHHVCNLSSTLNISIITKNIQKNPKMANGWDIAKQQHSETMAQNSKITSRNRETKGKSKMEIRDVICGFFPEFCC